MFNPFSLLSPFSLHPLFEFLLSFLFLGQANVRSIPSVASSLESEDSEGGYISFLLCFLFFLSFYAFLLSSSSMAKPLASLPSFSHFAKVSSLFLQLAMCPFLESSKKLKEQEEEFPPQEADTGFPFFLLSFFLPPLFFELSLFLPFFCE